MRSKLRAQSFSRQLWNRARLPWGVRAPSRKSLPSKASIHSTTKLGSGGAQGRPQNMYTRGASKASSAAMYKRNRTRVQPGEHLGHLQHAVSLKQLGVTEPPPRGVRSQGLNETLTARADPRSATRHRWRFIVAATHTLSYRDSSMC